MIPVIRLNIAPCPKPRMTFSDRWKVGDKKRPAVAKYHYFRDQVKDKIKLIRFGQQGVKGEGDPAKSDTKAEKARRKAFKARHKENIKRGKMSAAYWANKVKW